MPRCSILFFPLSLAERRAVQMPKSQIMYALHGDTYCKGNGSGLEWYVSRLEVSTKFFASTNQAA